MIIQVLTQDEFSDPDIYLSFTNTKPNSPGSSEFVCASQGRDTCTISSNQLLALKQMATGKDQIITLYVGIVCESVC